MKLPSLIPLGSMGLVYLPINLPYKSAIHGSVNISIIWILWLMGLFVSHVRKVSSKPEATEMFREVLDGTLKEMVEPWGKALGFFSIQGMIFDTHKNPRSYHNHTHLLPLHCISNCCSVNFCEYMCNGSYIDIWNCHESGRVDYFIHWSDHFCQARILHRAAWSPWAAGHVLPWQGDQLLKNTTRRRVTPRFDRDIWSWSQPKMKMSMTSW